MENISHLDSETHSRHMLLNRVHTWLLAGGSLLLLVFCAWALAGPEGIFWAAIGGGVGLYGATHVSPQLVLRLYRAQKVPRSVFPEGHHLVDNLAEKAGLSQSPTLYHIPSKMMNAFAVGRAEDAVICITDGILRGLTLRELSGVLAHEISHIQHGDIKVMALADVVGRMTSIMSVVGILLILFHLPHMLAGGESVPWLAIFILMGSPTIGGLIQLALSRTREYDADLGAISLTGDPEGLASALRKLEKVQGRQWEAMAMPGGRIPEPSLLRTHPRTEDRIAKIMALKPRANAPDFYPPEKSPEEKPHVGHSIVPIIRRPRHRARGMGLWY
ncbi:MAG: zinc metalloprotease HtpX [Stappiaceae bacterium]